MADILDYKKEYKELYVPKNLPVIINVPDPNLDILPPLVITPLYIPVPDVTVIFIFPLAGP